MTSDRDYYLDKLSPVELLMYVEGGGKLVTRRMELAYAAALAQSVEGVPPANPNMDAAVAWEPSCSVAQRARYRAKAKAKAKARKHVRRIAA